MPVIEITLKTVGSNDVLKLRERRGRNHRGRWITMKTPASKRIGRAVFESIRQQAEALMRHGSLGAYPDTEVQR